MARFCLRCGTTAADADRFCGSCGTVLGEGDTTGSTTAPDATSPTDITPTAAAPIAASSAPSPTPTPSADPATVGAAAGASSAGTVPERIEAAYQRVGEYLRAADIKFMENRADHSYTALYGSAAAIVKVMPAGSDDTWVAFLAPVVSGATIRQDLLEYLLHRNADWAATKYHLSATNEIWLQYSVLGSILDAKTCKLAIAFTMLTADAEDDTIRSRWGGRRASEVLLGAPA
jgi:hypothetical protein